MSAIITPQVKKRKHNRSLFYRISAWLHLWLGLATGLVVVIVCLTGCIWIFKDEITDLLQPETRIGQSAMPVLAPSQLKAIAQARYPGEKVAYASFQQGRAAYIGLGEARKPSALLRINPYNGAVVRVQEFREGETDFFRWILNGHRFLWMGQDIGRPIVNYSTLIFVLLLVTGLVLWWPRKWNKGTRQQSFRIKWGASFKRVNYDLHNVLGFYALLVLAAIALSGMVYGIEWYSKGLYWVSSGGRELVKGRPPKSDSLQAGRYYTADAAMDAAWQRVLRAAPEAKGFYYAFPDAKKPAAPISIFVYPTAGRFYDRQGFLFDQHTLKALKGNPVADGAFADARPADKLRRMNFEIHVGSILGLPGRVLAFLCSLIGATLPVTGFLVWLGKRRKARKTTKPAKPGAIAKRRAVIREAEAVLLGK